MAAVAAIVLRYDFNPPEAAIPYGLAAGVIAGLLQVVLGLALRLYTGRYLFGSVDDARAIALVALSIGLGGTAVLSAMQVLDLPRSTYAIATGGALLSMLGLRIVVRSWRRQRALKRDGRRAVIYGAGFMGTRIADLLLAEKGALLPIGYLDDDPAKLHFRRSGLRVLGSGGDLESVINRYEVESVLIAWTQATAAELVEIERRCRELSVSVQVVPTATEVAGGSFRLGDLNEITDEDLLGRRAVDTDRASIERFLAGRCVLITGAGGSIGSELARQIASYAPKQLFMLDRDESALLHTKLTLDGSGDFTQGDLVLADIRDAPGIFRLFESIRPDIVFHAAALKHLAFLERFPSEAYQTNVEGTKNVLQAAAQVGTKVVVNLSTYKAADPTSVLGFSKLASERLTAGATLDTANNYFSIRFGTALGSRGTVLEVLRHQISQGGPVTITDARAVRDYRTLVEAVDLVLHACTLASAGDTMVLEAGSPVRILDIANQLMQRTNRDVPVVFTGLRPGERLTEVPVGQSEVPEATSHREVRRIRVQPLRPTDLSEGNDYLSRLRDLASLS